MKKRLPKNPAEPPPKPPGVVTVEYKDGQKTRLAATSITPTEHDYALALHGGGSVMIPRAEVRAIWFGK